MSLFESVRVLAGASGDGAVDWEAVTDAAKAATDPGSLDLAVDEQEGYAADVRDARDRVRVVSGLAFDLPDRIEVQNRHHWIDANVRTFRRALAPLDDRPSVLPGLARTTNTATTAIALAFFADNVLGQYDPVLLAGAAESETTRGDGGAGVVGGGTGTATKTGGRGGSIDDHALYFVHPNVARVADDLAVDMPRFRRWIAFHEVTHAAEFGAAPWLPGYLEERMERGLEALAEGRLTSIPLKDLTTAMTAVEGYAELLMDRAFDEEYADLREKVEERRRGGDPLTRLLRRIFGLGMKRRQYERGKAFFDTIADARGVEGAGVVWADPANLPSDRELDRPSLWLSRVPA